MARRRSGRHTRRSRRTTPRRWLPFLALIAIIAAAVVVTAQTSEPEQTSLVIEAPSSELPVAAEPDALSTAWYCAGGTADGEGGAAELSVVIANVAERGTTAEVVVIGSNGERRRSSVKVPASGRTRVIGSEMLTSAWIGMTVEVLGGRATVEREVSGSLGVDVSPCSSTASARWYIPSGSTVQGAGEQLVLFNPFPDATSVDITFATDAGRRAPEALQGLSIPGRALRMVPTDSLPANRPELATIVTARTGRLVVDRVQTYDGSGEPVTGTGDDPVATDAPTGLGVTAAIPATASRWLFPQGINSPGTRTQLAIYNPGGRSAEVDVVVTHEDPERFGEVVPIELTVRGGDQQLVDLTDVAGIELGAGYTIDVRSLQGVPVAAEQLVFGAVPVAPPVDEAPEEEPPSEEPPSEEPPSEEPPSEEPPAGEEAPPDDEPVATSGLAVVAGSPVAADRWFLASRGASSDRTASVVVANPGAKAVTVRVDQVVKGNRSPIESATVRVPAGDRRVIDLREATINPALLVRADGHVVVSHSIVVDDGVGIAQSLATPMPETVVELPGTT